MKNTLQTREDRDPLIHEILNNAIFESKGLTV